MKWQTSLSDVRDDKEIIRGYDLIDLIKKKSFVETIFLLWRGELPTKQQTRVLEAMFTAAIDHGIGTASAMTTRIVASAKNSLHTSVAAGILALGELHGSAIEGAARFFQEHINEKNIPALVQDLKNRKVRIPGYGHAVLEEDPRSQVLLQIAKEQGIAGKYCALAEQIKTALNNISSKKLPLNIDGAMAAIVSDMGFDWRLAKGFFMVARLPGLIAHAYEEMTKGPGLRRLSPEQTEYTGSQP